MMNKILLLMAPLYLVIIPAFGQITLIPQEGFEVETWIPEYPSVGAFDFSDTLFYLSDGDTIHILDISSGVELNKFGFPDEYASTSYISFMTVSPDGSSIWTGYTTNGNLDDRIYSINVETGEWKLKAMFPGNMDLAFWKDSILVSGLNSTSWDEPASIFVLDTSGADQHRKIIEIGGYSAGMAIDQTGNIYYGSSYATDPNALYRWDYSVVRPVIEIPGKVALTTFRAEKLTDLPAGAYDCEVDEGGNVLFNMNLYGGTMVVGMWNGIAGDGNNIDTLATAAGEWDWLGILKSKGNIAISEPGNMVVTYSFGQPLAKISRKNTVGVKLYDEYEWNVFPNPSEGIYTISFEGTRSTEVKVYTVLGGLVYEKQDYTSGGVIDITGQPAGTYIFRMTNGKEVTGKLIQKL
jgi:hypothetical protein